MQISRWHVFPTVEALQERAAQEIIETAHQAIAARGMFNLVLAGGNTPRAVYERLCDAHANCAKWYIYFGDERCLPPNHPERNSVMALNAWLNASSVPHNQIFIMPAEQGASRGAEVYERVVKGVVFDLVLLGLGEDGHTASLFPEHEWGVDAGSPDVLSVHDAPKPPSERMSLSAQCLSHARKVMYLVTGEGKRHAVKDWRAGKAIPAASISPVDGVDVMLEEVCLSHE